MAQLAVASIRLDGGTQSRALLSEETIVEYAEALAAGAKFPPPVVFYDGSDHWLADGFHRVHAYRRVERKRIECDVRQGGKRDAVLFSVGANAAHGLRRTNADKRRAVDLLLRDAEWSKRSDRWIAEKCGVGHPFVAKQRPLESDSSGLQRDTQDGRKHPAKRKLPEPRETALVQPELVTAATLVETTHHPPSPPAPPARSPQAELPLITEPTSSADAEDEDAEERWNATSALLPVAECLRSLLRDWPAGESMWSIQVFLTGWMKTIERLEERRKGAA